LEDLHPHHHPGGGGDSDDHHEDASHNNSSPVQKKRSMLGFFKKRSKDKETSKHHTDKEKEKEISDHDKLPPPPPSSSSSGRPGLFRSHSDVGTSSHKKGGGGKESDGKSFSPPASPSQHGHKTPEKTVGFATTSSPPSYHSHTANNGYNNSGGRKPTTPRRKSEKEIKTESSLLRQQIATTEYELERLAKNIRKKMIAGSSSEVAASSANTLNNTTGGAIPPPSASKSGGDKRLVTPAEYNALQEQQQELQTKLVNLKKQHVELTGITYEQARRERSTFSRLRSLGSSGKKVSQQNQSYSNTLPMAMATPNNNPQELMGMPEATAEPMSNQSSPARDQMINNYMFKDPSRTFPRPLHWLSYQ
jgi:hypothetical protein